MTSTATTWRARPSRIFRHSDRDVVLVGLALAHGALLISVPSIPLVAIGLWWNANTIAHHFIHRPFFRAAWANRAFSGLLTLLLGVPQRVWRERHLAHHADRPVRLTLTRGLLGETALVVSLWTTLAVFAADAFLWIYVPGWALGFGLCALQGHYEHAGGTTSHYGRIYNALFFNDGYHVEHHARPGAHWTALAARSAPDARASRWPPVLRWLDAVSLCGLERLVARSPRLQRFVVDHHERAFRTLFKQAGLSVPETTLVVGGGLFPRTALVLRRLLPTTRITVADASSAHLALAQRFIENAASGPTPTRPSGAAAFTWIARRCSATDVADLRADLVVVPLAYVGDKRAFFTTPPAPVVIVHDWIWHRRGTAGVVVSWLLLKRLNAIVRV